MRLLFALVIVSCTSFHRPDEIAEGPFRELGKCMVDFYRSSIDVSRDAFSLSDSRESVLFKRDVQSRLRNSTDFVHNHQSIMKLVLLSSPENRRQAIYILTTHLDAQEAIAKQSAQDIGNYSSVPAVSAEAVVIRSMLRSHAARVARVRAEFEALMEKHPKNESSSGFDLEITREIDSITKSIDF